MPFCHFEFDNAIPTFGQKVKLGHRICNSNPFGWKFSSIEDSKGDVFTSISFVFHSDHDHHVWTKTRNTNDASCHQNSECVCMNPLARFPNCQASGLGSLTSDPPAPKSVETRSCDFSQSLFDIGTLVDPCPPFLEPCPQSIGFYGLPYPPSWYQ